MAEDSPKQAKYILGSLLLANITASHFFPQ